MNAIYDLNDIIEDFFSPFYKEESHKLKSDIYETEKEIVIEVLVPGLTKEDIKIDFDNQVLKVEANYKEDPGLKYLVKEIPSSTYHRNFNISNRKIENISAKLEDGILRITLTKELNALKNQKINIE